MIKINKHPKISFIEMFKGIPKTFKYNVTKKFWDLFVPEFTQKCIDEQVPYFESSFRHWIDYEGEESIVLNAHDKALYIYFTNEPENFTEQGIEEGQDMNFVLFTEEVNKGFASETIDFKDKPFWSKENMDEVINLIIEKFRYRGK